MKWTFNFDAAASFYTYGHSLYTNPRNGIPGDQGSKWFEGFAKPAISASLDLKTSELFGKLSVVGERTYAREEATVPGLVGGIADSFYPEDFYVGWRSGSSIAGIDTNGLELSFGREQFTIGTGFLVYDGASEGGSRGGYWSNARKSFALAGIGRIHTGMHKFELFYLDRDELPEADSKSKLWGANYELAPSENLTVGLTYLRCSALDSVRPDRNGMNVYDFRLSATPLANLPLSLEGEYALEKNGDRLSSNGWYAQASYKLSHMGWQPKLSYRYAFFEGDDPATKTSEAFDPLFLGFYDWGTWWQGEIAGEYFISNSNMISHQVRLHLSPSESVGTGLIFYLFRYDRPEAIQPGLASDKVATEIDWYMDWKINGNFTASFVAAWAQPGDAVKQVYDRTKDFGYAMIYLAYSY